MKLLYLVSLALASTCVPAQSPYQLFRPGVQYLYEDMQFQPSFFASGGQYYGVLLDSLECGELYNTLGGYANDPSVFTCRVSMAFGNSVCQTADSTVLNYDLDGPFVIYQNAAVGERWIAFRSANVNIEAEVVATDSANVLGLPDTMKRIQFATEAGDRVGTEMVISKRYGLVVGQRFDQILFERGELILAGMDAPVAGLQLPPAAEFDTLAVGDEIHVETINRSRTIGPDPDGPRYDRYTQETVEVIAIDSVTEQAIYYTVRGDMLSYNASIDPGRSNRDSTLTRDTVRQLQRPRYPTELADLQPGESFITGASGTDTIYQTFMVQDGPCGLLTARLSSEVVIAAGERCGLDASQVDGGLGYPFTPHVPVYIDTVPGQDGTSSRTVYLATPDTVCGTPFDFSDIIIGVREFDAAFDAEFQVFPNPTGSQLNVVLPGTANYEVRLYNLAGSQVQSQWMRGGNRQYLATDALPAGTYFLVVFEGGRAVGRRQVIVE